MSEAWRHTIGQSWRQPITTHPLHPTHSLSLSLFNVYICYITMIRSKGKEHLIIISISHQFLYPTQSASLQPSVKLIFTFFLLKKATC